MQLNADMNAVYRCWWPSQPFLFAWLKHQLLLLFSTKHLVDFLLFPPPELCLCSMQRRGRHSGWKRASPSTTLLASGCWVNRGLVILILLPLSPKWCTVHTMLLDKVWWHKNLSLLFRGSDHYPNGLYIVVMGKILMASMSIALDYFKSD